MSSNSDTPVTGNADFDTGLRLGLLQQLGDSGFDSPGVGRDRYEVFGWEKDPDKEEYFGLYLRNPYAHAIIDRPASVTWRDTPTLEDDTLQDAFLSLERQHDLTQYFNRADRAAGPAEYSLLFIDFDDTNDPSGLAQPYNPDNADLDSIRGHRVFTQLQVENVEYGSFGSDNWGEPERYDIDLTDDVDDDSDLDGSVQVHASRVVTIPSTRLFDDETKSRPRLEPVLNPLYDIEKTLGSAAEQSYRGADYGLHLNADPTEVDGTSNSFDQLGEEVQKWYHGLQPWLRTQGVDVERLGGDIQDPSNLIGSELDAISAQTGIPKRILTGDAQGELAASQEDTSRWYGHIRSRQQQYAEPLILRRYVDALISHGVLDQPADGFYDVEWPDLFEQTEQEEADTQKARSATVQQVSKAAPGYARELIDAGYIEDGSFPDESASDTAQPPGGVGANAGRDWFSDRFELDESTSRETTSGGGAVEGNAETPLPPYIQGTNRITRNLLKRWVFDTAGRQTANDWNPALHPRDPETGKFVERSFPASGVTNDMVSNTPASDLLVRLSNAGENVDSVLADDSVSIDGVPDEIDTTSQLKDYIESGTLPGNESEGNFSKFNGTKFSVNAWTASLAKTALNRMVYQEDQETRYGGVREKFSELHSTGDWSDGSATVKLTQTERNRILEALREYKDGVDRVVESGREETLMLSDPEKTQRRLQTAIVELTGQSSNSLMGVIRSIVRGE